MSETLQLLFPILVAATLGSVSTLLGRRSNMQFAAGSVAIFLIALVVSISEPNIFVQSQTVLWQGAYSTTFPLLSTLYAIAHIAIWRSFTRPSWLAFLTTVPAAWFFASVGFWEVIV